ncbi:MAG: toll/interleukin-1 receptor domain-containing protein [Phycisphaerales bacterium]|nr:MAG: toll/interleukin-1 receptor domain-containing protein [Phycisphaerales bacterium]
MDRDEALKLLRGGKEGIAEWNLRRSEENEKLPDLIGADFRHADLRRANLGNAKLGGADVSGADFRLASLLNADLSNAILCGTNLRDANLARTDLSNALLFGATFAEAQFALTIVADVDLSRASGLEEVDHGLSSRVSVDTLAKSKGRIPDKFLQGCGFLPWQVLEARMYDPTLTAAEIERLLCKIFDLRTTGAIFLGGVFISYAHEDSAFVDEVYERLQKEGAPVWLDRHEAVAGPIKEQVMGAIRLNDIVLLVLSKDSVKSDWVTHELKAARRREKKERRDILCPVALDDSWKAKCEEDPDWGHLPDKNILNFAAWETEAFDEQFEKLIRGFKRYYKRRGEDGAGDAAAE